MKELSEATVRGLSALHLLMQSKRPVSTKGIAAAVKAPEALVEPILSKLAHAGLIKGRRGRGYILACAPGEIRLEDIIRTLEDPQEPTAPCGGDFEACPSRASCVLSILCRKVDESFTEAIRTFTLADLKEITPDVPNCMDPGAKRLASQAAKAARGRAKRRSS